MRPSESNTQFVKSVLDDDAWLTFDAIVTVALLQQFLTEDLSVVRSEETKLSFWDNKAIASSPVPS